MRRAGSLRGDSIEGLLKQLNLRSLTAVHGHIKYPLGNLI
jgi:hypothetical protein